MLTYKNLDIFSQNFGFKVNKSSSSFKTHLGATITIICFFLTATGVVIFLMDYLNTTSPKVTISKERTNEFPRIELGDNNFLPILTITDSSSAILEESEAIKRATPVITKHEFGPDPSNPLKLKYRAIKSLRYVDCRQSKLGDRDINKLLEESNTTLYYNLGLLLCPEDMEDPDFWVLEGSGTQFPQFDLSISLYPCSLEDQTHCANQEEMSGIRVSLSLMSLTYNLKNKTSPRKNLHSSAFLTTQIVPSTTLFYNTFFKKIRIFDEDWDFAKEKLNTEFFSLGHKYSFFGQRDYSIYCSQQQIDSLLCAPYVSYFFKSGADVETVSRIYPKFFSMMSEVGGFSDLVFIIMGFFYSIYNNYYYKRFIKEQLINKKTEADLRELSKRLNLKVTEFESAKGRYLDQSFSGIDVVKRGIVLDSLINLMVGPEHAMVMSLFPILDLMGSKEDPRITRNRKFDEIPAQVAINLVKNKRPSNKVEKAIKKRLVKYLRITREDSDLGQEAGERQPRNRETGEEGGRKKRRKKKMLVVDRGFGRSRSRRRMQSHKTVLKMNGGK